MVSEGLLKQMLEQMEQLRNEVQALRAEHRTLPVLTIEDEDVELDSLDVVSEATKAFLETAFSSNLENLDCKKRVGKYGTLECDHIRCPKLDPVLKTTLQVDGYLLRLQQFWLDAVAPLNSVLEHGETSKLTPKYAVSTVQSALVLMGNAHQHMAQERDKKKCL
jgi:hypothetical protein